MDWLYFLIVVEKVGSAFGCAHIMKKKGRSYAGGWWIGMAIGGFGFIIVCNKSDISYQHSQYVQSLHYQYDENGVVIRPNQHNGWKCLCGRIHRDYEGTCICGCNKLDAAELVFIENTPPVTVKTINNGTEKIADKPNLSLQELKEDEWLCSNCEHINNIEKKSCYYCGAIKDRMMYM